MKLKSYMMHSVGAVLSSMTRGRIGFGVISTNARTRVSSMTRRNMLFARVVLAIIISINRPRTNGFLRPSSNVGPMKNVDVIVIRIVPRGLCWNIRSRRIGGSMPKDPMSFGVAEGRH